MYYPNSVIAAYGYDPANNLTSIDDTHSSTDLYSFDYPSPDGNGRVTSISDPISAATDGYAYDQFGRMRSDAVTGGATTTYTPDAAGNITDVSGADGSESALSYDDAGELQEDDTTADSDPVSTVSYSYDDMGNRVEALDGVSCSATQYQYDEGNRLISWQLAYRTLGCHREGEPHLSYDYPNTFTYDGDGLLTGESNGSFNAGYVWDHSGATPTLAAQVVEGFDSSTDTTEYIAGPNDLPVEQWDSGTGISYYLQDRLGSTRVLLDPSRDVQATYDYTPFGQVTQVGGDSSASTPLLYDGQLTDTFGGSGLIYMRARWYDPATMQFMSRDPAVSQTLQPFAYGGDDPLNSADPTGLLCHSGPDLYPGLGFCVGTNF